MSDRRDPLDRLRAADPTPNPVSTPDQPAVRATLEEIIMTDTLDAPTPETTPLRQPWYRQPRILAVAACALLVLGVAGAVTFGGDDDPDFDQAALPIDGDATDDDVTSDDLFPGDEPTDGITPGGAGTELTSCVELYSPETLTNREYAFDGTVESIDGDDMTFTVNEWFSGGTDATVTLDHQGQARAFLDPDTQLEPGTRALIAGDGGFVWSCGFTQLWTEDAAAEWRGAFAG